MTEQITVPRATWDAMREALEESNSLLAALMHEKRSNDEIEKQVFDNRVALTAANAVSEAQPAGPEDMAIYKSIAGGYFNAVQPQTQGEADKMMRDCFEILDSFSYEDDEDSQSKAFFKAHIDIDWFFYVKNSLERQLKTEANK